MTCRLLDILFYISMTLIIAKTTGIVCLMGVGFGFGLTAYILYRISLNKPSNAVDQDGTSEDSAERNGNVKSTDSPTLTVSTYIIVVSSYIYCNCSQLVYSFYVTIVTSCEAEHH